MAASTTAAQVHGALARTDIIALATLDEDGGSWTSPVQFHYDASLHLYFASAGTGWPCLLRRLSRPDNGGFGGKGERA